MRRGRVQLGVSLDFDEPQSHAFEQLVTAGRRRCCAKPSRQLAQLYRSFFISHRLTSLVVMAGIRGGRRASPSRSVTGALCETCALVTPADPP
jgi:hypothetical protein